MNALEFNKYINHHLDTLASFYGVTNLSDYYVLTDYRLPEINTLSGINQVFAQFILHAQNGTMISGIVRFFDNYDFLKEKLCDFNPKELLITYEYINEDSRDDTVKRIVDTLRFNKETKTGLKWTTEKSEKPDYIITRFANTLIDGALYFKNFKTKQQVVDDLKNHYPNGDYRKLINYLRRQFKHGFSVALCCDFLKEFDTYFDLPKPDVHLMEVLAKYKGYNLEYYKHGDKRAFECLDDFLEVINEIKEQDNTITAYKLDRQIWLCCTANFFLSAPKRIKTIFINGIQ